jgi:hypothetical protein
MKGRSKKAAEIATSEQQHLLYAQAIQQSG